MSDLINQITADLEKQIESFQPEMEVRDVGTVLEAGDGIARVSGLSDVRAQELVQFSNGVLGIAFNLEHDNVGVIIMGEYSEIEEGMRVHSTGRISSVPVGDGLIGRVVNAIGQPIDGKGPLKFDHYRPIERIAPGVVDRKDVDTPMQTGIESDRRDDPDWSRPAGIDHWRPPDREDGDCHRHDHQPEGQGPLLHLCGYRSKEGRRRPDSGHPGTIRRDGVHDGRSRRSG